MKCKKWEIMFDAAFKVEQVLIDYLLQQPPNRRQQKIRHLLSIGQKFVQEHGPLYNWLELSGYEKQTSRIGVHLNASAPDDLPVLNWLKDVPERFHIRFLKAALVMGFLDQEREVKGGPTAAASASVTHNLPPHVRVPEATSTIVARQASEPVETLRARPWDRSLDGNRNEIVGLGPAEAVADPSENIANEYVDVRYDSVNVPNPQPDHKGNSESNGSRKLPQLLNLFN